MPLEKQSDPDAQLLLAPSFLTIQNIDLSSYLSPQARSFLRRNQRYATILVSRPMTPGAEGTMDAEQLQHYLADCSRLGLVTPFGAEPVARLKASHVSFSKVVYVDNDQPVPERFVVLMARALQKLYDAGQVVAGMLHPGLRTPLVPETDGPHAGQQRSMVGFFTYALDGAEPSHTRLNNILRCRCFVGDGELGDGDWTSLEVAL